MSTIALLTINQPTVLWYYYCYYSHYYSLSQFFSNPLLPLVIVRHYNDVVIRTYGSMKDNIAYISSKVDVKAPPPPPGRTDSSFVCSMQTPSTFMSPRSRTYAELQQRSDCQIFEWKTMKGKMLIRNRSLSSSEQTSDWI